jgi:pimeloyl-ACP methyl ester carboxylesterase
VRWRFGLIAVVTAIVVVAAGCSGPRVQWKDDGAAATDGAIAWRDCRSQAVEIARKLQIVAPKGVAFECGTVTVPQDWTTAKDGKATDGKNFEIALIRARRESQTDRIGSLLTNPGGPGASGVDYAVYLAGQVPGLMGRFDLIGFDPRGVSRSAPVKCISDPDMDASFGYEPDPLTDASFSGMAALAKKIADACGAKYGENLRLFSTEQAAHDVDAIRAALGDEKLTYLGYSYGTLLGAVYAQLFPTNIRAMVLDGAVDPQESPIAGSEGQAKGFERAFANFVNWCAQNPGTACPIAPDARGAVLSALRSARTLPVRTDDGREATAGWIYTGVFSSLYAQQAWPLLARGISDLRRGDPEVIFFLADVYADRDSSGHFSNLFDAYLAVNCADSEQYPTPEDVRALQADWRAKYPVFGAPIATSMLTCGYWPVKHDPYPVGPATGSPPIVVVGTTGDPATPYEATPRLAQLLGSGTVVTWEGEGHTAYPETKCIRTAVEEYLIDLKVPAADLTCPAQ